MTKAIIFKRNINNNFWPKLIFVIIYVKNNQLIKTLLQNFNLYKAFIQNYPNIFHLCILGFTIYIFLYKKNKILKLKK